MGTKRTARPSALDPNTLPADMRERFEERAGILQYDGGLPRVEAERLAAAEIAAAVEGNGQRRGRARP